jgi:hypothetical protein
VRFASGAKFAVLSFLCVMVFALTMGFALSSLLARAVHGWEWENTAALARREVELRGVDTLLASPRRAALDERTRHEILTPHAGPSGGRAHQGVGPRRHGRLVGRAPADRPALLG